jgi:hypothetical protein
MDERYQTCPELQLLYEKIAEDCNAYMADFAQLSDEDRAEVLRNVLGTLSGLIVNVVHQFWEDEPEDALAIINRIHVGMVNKLAEQYQCPPGTKPS